MLAIVVVIAYIFLILLAIFVTRAIMDSARISETVLELQKSHQAQARRVDQLASAINNIQGALLNISAGAADILRVSESRKANGLVSQLPQQQKPPGASAQASSLTSSTDTQVPTKSNSEELVDTVGKVVAAVRDVVKDVVNGFTAVKGTDAVDFTASSASVKEEDIHAGATALKDFQARLKEI